ncbi:MAG: hypothetical protein JWN74_2427 [Acidobacteriaceae bacterium]|nr:hypothetical protein [Acidobacteriaceae bacterium]
MTRKHFRQIADALRYMRKIEIDDVEMSATGVRVVKFSSVVDALAGILAESNPRFNRDKFLEACGIGAEESKLKAAQEAIEREDQVCFDVCAEHCQIFGNVKHTTWFLEAVAEAL